MKRLTSIVSLALIGLLQAKAAQPNILMIITDDQRPDSISAFNKAVSGSKLSPLGYVMSPFADKLAAEGTLFSQAYTNSPACAPSRASIHTGRYPFRNGIYGFEQAHPNADFTRPTIPQVMRQAGYMTAEFGKHGYRIFEWGPGLTWKTVDQYDHWVDKKNDLSAKGKTDFFPKSLWGKGGYQGKQEIFFYPDGSAKSYYVERKKGESITDEDIATRKAIDEELDILRAYTRQSELMIIGGQSSQPAELTQDGQIATAFVDYLANEADAAKPLFVNLGFHFPHTPVLAPKEFREHFIAKEAEIPYQIPEFDPAELEKMPAQLQKLHKVMNFSNLSHEDKLQAIRDYYAFCAHGDAQVGRSIEAFKQYSQKNGQDWIIVYVVGDHSWHLGEQGIEAKFASWGQSTHNVIIAASSIQGLFPAGSHSEQFVEYVDLAPTFYQAAGIDLRSKDYDFLDGASLFRTVRGTAQRDYIVGEINHVVGPRAYLRSKDFAFSMRTRPSNGKPGQGFEPGEDIRWALDCPRDKAELALYDLRKDPLERWNVANDPEYRELADWFRVKLGAIVLGDRRVECNWKQENTYVISDFALGADDKKLDIPAKLIP
ncbi:sulfatase-like hydrolase/transferase [Coraliomargarita akajimensis]|uniref:Sulfatase n=1 Tax=Coraliomargarita akajimensis (strain DSM 45221 / IAM 15411 / JCM 23193 / KCTC 12865 / 04OKA010-24) TaxID=583355 RepID=D5EN19_CORAD|nr:sulfatase-like hydrolase/transferase [Coraliomargarita akajimensis]ADE53454.1 sulfatase [Coraliomargarita akajimensis DSM 45221]